jgi:hypothetical protein
MSLHSPEHLCDKCANVDTFYVLHGNHYVPKENCVYDMTLYPRASKCAKFEEKPDAQD